MTLEQSTNRTVVSTRGGVWALRLTLGIPTAMSLIILGLYLAMPAKMGPSVEHPNATTLSEMVAIVLVASFVTAFAWRLIAREVSLEDELVIVISGTGRRIAFPRAAVRSLGSVPMGHWYLVWLNLAREAEVRRVLFFSLSPHPVRTQEPGAPGPPRVTNVGG